MTRSMSRLLRSVAGAAVLLALWAGTASAQEFEKVEGALRPELPAGPFVGTAYGFIWIAVLIYVLSVARGLARVRREVEELSRQVRKIDSKIDGRIDGPGPRP
jgi:CcmD family protein